MNIKIDPALYSPIIPKEHVLSFNTSFWANLLSSAITGVLTGIIVGLFILFIQNKKLKNDEKQTATLEFNKIITLLKYKMLKSDFLLFNSKSVECLYSNIHESITYLMEQPIHYLEDRLKSSYNTEFKILKEAISSYQEFMPIADALDNHVIEAILNRSGSVALTNLDNDCGIIFALINGEAPHVVKNRFYMNDEQSLFLHSILDIAEIVQLADNYKTYRTKFLNKMYKIEEMFDI